MSHIQAYRSAILHCIADPADVGVDAAVEYFADGLLVVEDGHVVACGEASALLADLADGVEVQELPNSLLTPGFIDTHIHFPQVGVIASYGEQLLDWLNNYTFPAEGHFHDKQHASDMAELFLQELLRNGTTTLANISTR